MIAYYLLLVLSAFYEYVYLPTIGESLTLIKMVGIVAVAAAVLRWAARRERLYLFSWAEGKLFLLLFVWIVVSSIRTVLEYGGPPSLLWSYMSHMAYLFASLVFLDSYDRSWRACHVLVFSMLLAALSVFKDYVRWNVTRAGGVAGDANYYALIVLCILPMCFFLFRGSGMVRKMFLAGTGVLLVTSVLLSSSRGGLVALMISLCYAGLLMRRKAVFVIIAVVGIVAILLVLPQSGVERMLDPTWGEVKSNTQRLGLLKSGLEMIRAHPFMGVGAGMFKPMSPVYNSEIESPQIAHNTYLELGAEMGLPAVCIFVGAVFFSWRRARALGRHFAARNEWRQAGICRSIEVGLVGYSAAAVFLSAAYIRHLWIVVFLGLAMQRLTFIGASRAAGPVRTPGPSERPAVRPAAERVRS